MAVAETWSESGEKEDKDLLSGLQLTCLLCLQDSVELVSAVSNLNYHLTYIPLGRWGMQKGEGTQKQQDRLQDAFIFVYLLTVVSLT